MAETKRLIRITGEGLIAGIAAGLGKYLEIDPVIIRILLIVLTIFGGSGVVLYLLLWLIIPSQNQLNVKSADLVEENIKEIKEKSIRLVKHSRLAWGLLLILIATWFVLNNFGLLRFMFWGWFWPIILLIVGLFVLIY